ncbi:fimbrial protein, partial [Klebsiella michiganensis]|nr:fimbrial protein [Klebsiella michiganensis]
MKLNPLLLSLFLFTVTPSSHAINVGDVTSIMGPDASTLAKEIINTTDTARY